MEDATDRVAVILLLAGDKGKLRYNTEPVEPRPRLLEFEFDFVRVGVPSGMAMSPSVVSSIIDKKLSFVKWLVWSAFEQPHSKSSSSAAAMPRLLLSRVVPPKPDEWFGVREREFTAPTFILSPNAMPMMIRNMVSIQ